MATDKEIEQEIVAKGLTAPRVTPESIEAKIASEFYFTAADGVRGESQMGTRPAGNAESLERLTICILVLQNGFTILGKSAPASAANFDAELGRKIARQDAFNQIWPLEGYLLRENLYLDSMITSTQLVVDPLDGEGVPSEIRSAELIGGTVESDAIYKFAGWLTSRNEAITASGHDDAAPMAQAVAEYLAMGASNREGR